MNKFVLALLTVISTSVYAADTYRVVRNEPAFEITEAPVQVCQRMGAYGAPMCETFYNKVKVPVEGYHVIVKQDGATTEKFFASNKPYEVGSLIISNKE